MKLYLGCMALVLCLLAARAQDGSEGQQDERGRACGAACGPYFFAQGHCRTKCSSMDPLDEQAIKDCQEKCDEPTAHCINLCADNYETIMQYCEQHCSSAEPFCESRCFNSEFEKRHSNDLRPLQHENPDIFQGVPLLGSDENAEEGKKRSAGWSNNWDNPDGGNWWLS